MTVAHRITGYDRRTECLAMQRPVPHDVLAPIRALVGVPATDDDAIGSYPLDPSMVPAIARQLGAGLWPDLYDLFLEPVGREPIQGGIGRGG